MLKKVPLVILFVWFFVNFGNVSVFADTIYGVPWEVKVLGNTQVGHYETDIVSFRFKSKKNGNINQLRFYFIDDIKSDCRKYGDGDSGIFRITIQSDSGGNPSGNEVVAGSQAYYDPVDRCADPNDRACKVARSFPVVSFAKNIPLVNGTTYHIVFENVGTCNWATFYTCVDGQPTGAPYSACTNWSSVEGLQLFGTQKENQPARDYMNYTILSGLDPDGDGVYSWNNLDRTPIFEVFHDTQGRNQGMGYIICYTSTSYQDLFTLSGNRKVRQSFTPGSSFNINSLRLRIKKNQPGSLPLKATISTQSGSVLGSRTQDLAVNGSYTYMAFDFSNSPVAISAGTAYYLTIEPANSSSSGSYEVYALGEGSSASYGFTAATYFGDGRAEQSIDGSTWQLWKGYSQPNSVSDLPFYFETTPIVKSITVTSPNGGEKLYPGAGHNITWNSSGGIGNVKIEYYSGSWKTIVASTNNDGLFTWTIPNVNTSSARIRIKEASTGSYADTSNNTFSIKPRVPAVLTSPTGPILPGSTVTFKWSGGAGYDYFFIKVGNSKHAVNYHNGWSSYKFQQTVSGLPTDGSPVWVKLGSVFRKSDGSLDYSETTDTEFSAFHRVKAELTSPSGTSVSGSTYTFRWNQGFGFDYFFIKVGTTKGGTDIHNGWSGNKSSEQVTGLPADGSKVWVRLGSVYRRENGTLDYSNYTDIEITSN